jgi:uncharacterized protein
MNSSQIFIENVIQGSLFYGTGGGGDPVLARQILSSIQTMPTLVPLKRLSTSALCITGFTVGSLEAITLTPKTIKDSYQQLFKVLNKQIDAIIPVEIGPLSLALAFKLAEVLKLPVIDADYVGGRSTPEVFLETITLANLKRTPLLVVDTIGNSAVMLKSESALAEETFLRQFSQLSEKPALVLGYPLPVGQLSECVVEGTVSKTLNVGKSINTNTFTENYEVFGSKEIFMGKVTDIEPEVKTGFNAVYFEITAEKKTCLVYAKNENLICWINEKVIVTCPDLISFCTPNYLPLYNLEVKEGMIVKVIATKAPALWRSTVGQKLFNPKVFGFNFPPKLLQ